MIGITKLEDVEKLTHDTDPNFRIYDSDGVVIKFNGSTAKLETENTDLDAMIAAIKGEDGNEFVVTNNQKFCNSNNDMEPNKRNGNITVKMETENSECICPIDAVVEDNQEPQVIKKMIGRKLTTLQYKKVVSRTLKNGKTNSKLDTAASTGLKVSNKNVESECSQSAADGAFDGCISGTNDTISMNVGNNLISNAITTIKDGVEEKKICDSFECSSVDLSCFSSSSVSFKYSKSAGENEYQEVLDKSDLMSIDNDCCNARADSSSYEMAIDLDNDDAGAADVSLHNNQATILYNVQEPSEDIQEFSSIDLLNANINAVSCDLCKHPISRGVDEARSHIYKRHYMKNGFKCVLCNKIFIHACHLNSHNCAAEHTTSTKIVTFEACTESESIEKLLTVCFPNLVQHINISPPVPTTRNSTISMLNRGFRSKTKLKCTFCSTEQFPYTLHSLKHLKQALGICWLYKCLMCSYNTVHWNMCVRHCSLVHNICGQLWPGVHYMEIDEVETIKFQCNKLAFPSYYAV